MADLKEILKDNDLTGDILSYHTGALTRVKIDNALQANGYVVPLPNKASFHLYKMNGASVTDVWLITWFPMVGKYSTIKLTMKG